MSYTTPDFADDVIAQLTADGYTVHEGVPGEELRDGQFWFCWAADGADVETGDTCDCALSAWNSALAHRLANSAIEIHGSAA